MLNSLVSSGAIAPILDPCDIVIRAVGAAVGALSVITAVALAVFRMTTPPVVIAAGLFGALHLILAARGYNNQVGTIALIGTSVFAFFGTVFGLNRLITASAVLF